MDEVFNRNGDVSVTITKIFFVKGFGGGLCDYSYSSLWNYTRGAAPGTLQRAFLPLEPSLGPCGARIPRRTVMIASTIVYPALKVGTT